MFNHFLNTSEWYKNLDALSKDSIAGKLKDFLTRFISNAKAPKIKKIKNDNKSMGTENNSRNENNKTEQEKDDDSLLDDDSITEKPEESNENDFSGHINSKVVVKNNRGKNENDYDGIEEYSDGEQVHDGTEKKLKNAEINNNSDDEINNQTTAAKLELLKSRDRIKLPSYSDSEDD